MANRFVLTLLALLTGLVAQIGPAEARMVPVASVQMGLGAQVDSLVESLKAPRAPIALARLPEPGFSNTRRHAPAELPGFAPRRPLTVQTGSDRARQ